MTAANLKTTISQNRPQLALENGRRGCSCSEAILVTYGPDYGLDNTTAMKLAAGFGGGMGLMGKTCGAVTAAFMVLGLHFGTDDIKDGYNRMNTYFQVAEFAERFESLRGSLSCRDLCTGYSMATPEGAKALRASGIPAGIIEDAARLIEEIITERES